MWLRVVGGLEKIKPGSGGVGGGWYWGWEGGWRRGLQGKTG